MSLSLSRLLSVPYLLTSFHSFVQMLWFCRWMRSRREATSVSPFMSGQRTVWLARRGVCHIHPISYYQFLIDMRVGIRTSPFMFLKSIGVLPFCLSRLGSGNLNEYRGLSMKSSPVGRCTCTFGAARILGRSQIFSSM